jgi:hypothetical protein
MNPDAGSNKPRSQIVRLGAKRTSVMFLLLAEARRADEIADSELRLPLRPPFRKDGRRRRSVSASPIDAADPSPVARLCALEWGYYDAVGERGELLESLAISLREAAFRGQDGLIRRHMEDGRRLLREAGAVLKDLEAVGAAAADGDPA